MDTIAKAVINLREGTLQLEGPCEFVEKYLDLYKHLVVSLSTTPGKIVVGAEEEKDKPVKRKTRTRTGPTCTQKVQELIDDGYFKQPTTRAEVQSEILNRGLRFESKEVSAVLINAFAAGKLKRTGTGKDAQYYSNV